MKIAVSGSACTGKTTLAQNLAERLNITFIPEHFEALFALPQQRGGGAAGGKERIEAYRSVLQTKRSEEEQHDSFIVDRCPLDLMNLWLSQGLSRRPKPTDQFYRQCREAMATYDFVVIPPWGRLPVEPLHANGKQVRNLNPWALLHSHATIVGLARMWLRRGHLLVLPNNADSVEDRVNYVIQRVEAMKKKAPE